METSRHLFGDVYPYRYRLLGPVLCSVLLLGTPARAALLVQPVLDQIFVDCETTTLVLCPLLIVILSVMRGLLSAPCKRIASPGLCVLLSFFCTGCLLHPIATQVLGPRLHPRDPNRAAVTFVALGDMGTGGSAQTQVAHAMYSVCQRDGCDFVLGLGDNIYPHSVHSVRDPQFQDKFEHPYARFKDIDFWMILGNHDWKKLWTGAQAQVDYTLQSERWRLPHAHYGIPFLPPWLHLYGVDTSLIEAVVGVYQLQAAQAALCRQPGWRLLFGHYPTHSQWFVRRALEHLIRQCHIHVYFAGHDHHQAHLDWGFYQEIIEGAGGAELSSVRVVDPAQRFGSATHGFAWVRVTEDRLAIRFYDVHQTVLYAWETSGTSQ
jgi:tartrate-resistant acid phosphatase type 5